MARAPCNEEVAQPVTNTSKYALILEDDHHVDASQLQQVVFTILAEFRVDWFALADSVSPKRSGGDQGGSWLLIG